MCFSVRDPKIYTAKEDIVCYKIVERVGSYSCLNGFEIDLDKLSCFKSFHRGFSYELGYHYYNKNFPKGRKVRMYRSFGGQGLHSFIRRRDVSNCAEPIGEFRKKVAIVCYIPKGAKYLKNKFHYLSSDLVIKKVLKTRKKEFA